MDFILAASSVKHLIFLVVLLSVTWISYYSLSSSERYWILWSSLPLTFIIIGNTFKARFKLFAVTGIFAALFAFIAALLAIHPFLLAAYFFFLVLGSLLYQFHYPRYFFPIFLINFLTLLSGGLVVSFADALARLIFMLLGCAIFLFAYFICYFHFVRNEWQWLAIQALRQLKGLSHEIFRCFLQGEYGDNIYLYERRIHLQKNKYLQCICRLRAFTEVNDHPFVVLQQKIDYLYDRLLDSAQLLRRVTDHTSFAVCRSELQEVNQEINLQFDGLIAATLGKTLFPNVVMLQQKIQKLEDNYNHVLQIASREPLVFLLFIFSLKTLSDEIARYYEVASAYPPDHTLSS